jgi:hypothetical protein
MPRKLQACKECKKPCHGTRCSPCAHAQPGGTGFGRSTSVNSVGEFNASGIGHASGLSFTRCVNPTESGWTGKDRAELAAWCEANKDRMNRGTGAMHRPELLQNWTY